MRTNTSGYRGVSWHKGAQKWGAYIRVNGARHYLGLYDTAEQASEAYALEASRLRLPPDPAKERDTLLAAVRELYGLHGISALFVPLLEKQSGNLYTRLLKGKLKQPALLAELGLAAEYAAWRESARTYRGVTKPKWSWDAAVATAKEIVERDGDLPTVQECRQNGLSSLTNAVYLAGKTWDDLRSAVGLQPSPTFYRSRNGMGWRSRPEACLSDFLYARGIEHKKGERYPEDYSVQSGRRWAQYDLHFRTPDGAWIDVEIWGSDQNMIAGGRYQMTRALKEAWQAERPNFLGIEYQNCLKDARLTEILKPYISVIEPFMFDKPSDHIVETSHWSNADELLATCRELAAQMPDGIFPPEDWLRKRGKYVNRLGQTYNTLAERVNSWLGGTRNVRRLLDQAEASTTEWTRESVIQAWHEFEAKHGLTPSQCEGAKRQKTLYAEALNEARRIYQAAGRLGVRAEARNGRTARKIKWTRESTLAAWKAFLQKNRRSPTQCMSKQRRRTLPRAVTDEATNIYGAARRLGILEEARGWRGRALLPPRQWAMRTAHSCQRSNCDTGSIRTFASEFV